MAYLHSEGIQAGELKHGPLALIDETMPVILIMPNDNTHDVSCADQEEQRVRRARGLGVGEVGIQSHGGVV